MIPGGYRVVPSSFTTGYLGESLDGNRRLGDAHPGGHSLPALSEGDFLQGPRLIAFSWFITTIYYNN